MSDQKMNVHVDLPKALAMVQQAINEASLYAGFTYNLKIDENFIKYDLTNDSALGLIPITDNLDEINLYKEHYSMQSARTCLTHRDGVIRNGDVNGNNFLKICWYSIRVYIKRASGDEEDCVNGMKITEGDVIMCSPRHYKEKIFSSRRYYSF